MPLLGRYLIQIWEQSGGCAPRLVPFSEVRDLVYEEDDSDLSELIGYVGDYSKPKGTDIATDLATMWDDVYPKSAKDGTSISERMDSLDDTETGAVPALEAYVGDYSIPAGGEGSDIATDLATVYGSVETATTGLLDRATALEAVAPTTGAPDTAQVAAEATYDTDKITFTADAVGADGNDIDVVATCQLNATLGSGTTEITLVGATGLHSGSTPPLVSVQITQAAAEAQFSVTNTAGVIVCELPAKADGLPFDLTMRGLKEGIEAEMTAGGELNGVINKIMASEEGGSFDADAVATITAEIPFTAAANTVEEGRNDVMILLANDGTNFDDWDDVMEDVNLNSTLVTASAGAESEAGPFEAISLIGGLDITAGAPGAIRYEADKIWISVEESTTSTSYWAYASLTDPNE